MSREEIIAQSGAGFELSVTRPYAVRPPAAARGKKTTHVETGFAQAPHPALPRSDRNSLSRRFGSPLPQPSAAEPNAGKSGAM